MRLLDRFLGRIERRQADYTSQIISAVLASAGGGFPSLAIGAVETSASTIGRALSMAAITPADMLTRAITPKMLAAIGRQLVMRGEAVFLLDVGSSGLRFLPVATWDISGTGSDPSEWMYRADVYVPSGSRTYLRTADSLLHFKWSADPGSPWRGIGPLARGRLTTALASSLEGSLANQAQAPTGHVLPAPTGPDTGTETDPLAQVRADVAAINGGVLLTESMQRGWGDGAGAAPSGDWRQTRIGFDPSKEASPIRAAVTSGVLSCCGIPPALFDPDAPGTAQRESLRRFLHLVLEPLALDIASELTQKLEVPVSLSLDRIMASDLSGRARAFGSMVKAGMDVERAAALAGLIVSESE